MSGEGKLSAAEHCDSARISHHLRQRFSLFRPLFRHKQKQTKINARLPLRPFMPDYARSARVAFISCLLIKN
ncbi:hypothetical protein J4543_13060, partial [Klebsiella pneumoniae]|uniref:hypothetical protein n=2 Tax=Klebsiella pneumoniae TaxID=573 RepID=UPI00200522F8